MTQFSAAERSHAARTEANRLGRKRDHTRDATILDATLEVLAQVGYEGLTMDLVAAQAKAGKATLYRRWASKGDLLVDAIARMKRAQVDLDQLPDTGSLRGDLLALYRPQSIAEAERKLKIMAGLASLLSHDRKFAAAADAALVGPWADAYLILMRRAIERDEIPGSADITTLAQAIPSIAAYRALVQRQPFDLAFLTSLIDGVLLPALGLHHLSAAPGTSGKEEK